MLTALVLVVFAQTSAQGAWSSARPPECASLDSGKAANVWERAKAPELRKYCDLLASGTSKLAGSAGMREEVLAIAATAERTIPGKAAPSVLAGRALTQLGDYGKALAALREAKSRDERALDDPLALFAWARVLARTGQLAEAATAYRALLPRASTLTLADRSAAAVEAGMLAMERGPAGLDEATPIFRQAVRDSQDVAQLVAVLSLAIALDRAGSTDESRALLAERVHGDPRPLLANPRARDMFAPSVTAESHALAALALESVDAGASRDEWEAYLAASASGPWAPHARAHLAQVGKRAPRRAEHAQAPAAPARRGPLAGMTFTSSGLGIQETRQGSGRDCKTGDSARVHYVLTLPDGTEVDSSRTRSEPFAFVIGRHQVIQGFEEGVIGMRPGGVRRVLVPPALGYGARGQPPKIPPATDLTFEIELVDARPASP